MHNNSNAHLMLVLGRVEGKIDGFHDTMERHLDDDAKVEVRVRKVERKQSWFIGGLAASWAIVGAAWKFFTM